MSLLKNSIGDSGRKQCIRVPHSRQVNAVHDFSDRNADQRVHDAVVRIEKHIAASCLRDDNNQKNDTGKLCHLRQMQPHRKVDYDSCSDRCNRIMKKVIRIRNSADILFQEQCQHTPSGPDQRSYDPALCNSFHILRIRLNTHNRRYQCKNGHSPPAPRLIHEHAQENGNHRPDYTLTRHKKLIMMHTHAGKHAFASFLTLLRFVSPTECQSLQTLQWQRS